jgi:hypothetical protein
VIFPLLDELNKVRLTAMETFDERNNFRVEGAAIRDHLRGRFGSGLLEIETVLKT